MKNWIGRWLCAAAVIHIAVAAAQNYQVFGLIWRSGIFNTVAGNPVIGAVVWSVLFGAVAFIGGLAVDALEKTPVAPPKSLGWSLLTLALAGVILMPVSGFWLIFPPSVAILSRKFAARAD